MRIKERPDRISQVYVLLDLIGTLRTAGEGLMNLFRVVAEREQEEAAGARTWLVVAGSLFEAMSLIPDSYTAKVVEVRVGAASGPGRVIDWMGPPSRGPGQARSKGASARCPPSHRTRPGAFGHGTNRWLAQCGR